MLRKTLLFLCLITICIVRGEEDCDDCTIIASQKLREAATFLKRGEPVRLRDVPPTCSKCTATGLSTAELTEGSQVCPSPTAEGGQELSYEVTFASFNVTCTCQLPCNPMNILTEFTKLTTAECSRQDSAEEALTVASAKYPPIPSSELEELSQCAAAATANMECEGTETHNDQFVLMWTDVKTTFSSFIDSNGKVTPNLKNLVNVF